jgi:hypothetical protein
MEPRLLRSQVTNQEDIIAMITIETAIESASLSIAKIEITLTDATRRHATGSVVLHNGKTFGADPDNYLR